MTDRSGAHFSDDEELLSRYVLGTLDAAERERIDRHAAGCTSCMESLRREMRIAAGVRRLGRQSVKAELGARVALRAERASWPRFASAAAVFIVVGGLGIYFGWLSGRGRLSPEPAGAPPIAGGSGGVQKEERNSPDFADARSSGKPAGLPPSAADHGAEQGASAPAVSPAPENARQSVDIVGGMAATRTEAALQSGASRDEFWSDGLVEQSEEAAKKIEPRGAVAVEDKGMVLEKQKSVKEEVDRFKDAMSRRQSHFILYQQPASALPTLRKGDTQEGRNAIGGADRRVDQRAFGGARSALAGGRDRVPTRVGQKGDTTTMTLYLDSLVDENELKRARVDALGDDSVVVTLGGKKIQYRFPPTQGAQQQRQK
jgi:hypothetical protein